MISEGGDRVILPLIKTSIQDKNYDIYNVKLTEISLANGLTKISLVDFNTNYHTDFEVITLNFDNHNFLANAKVLADIATDLSVKYEQISEMTKLNIDIYKNIKEVSSK